MGTPTGTQLQIATDSGFQSIVVDKSGGYSTTVQVSENDFSVAQSAGTTLYSRIKHIADTGDSDWSDIVNFTIRNPWSALSFGTPVTIDLNMAYLYSTAKLDNSRILVVFRDPNYAHSYASVLTVAGSTITNSITITTVENSNSTFHTYCTKVSETTALVVYGYGLSSEALACRLLTIPSGSTNITVGARRTIQSSLNADYIEVKLFDVGRVCILYKNYTDNKIYTIVLTVVGDNITSISSAFDLGVISSSFALNVLSTARVLVSYQNSSDNGRLYTKLLNIAGSNTITLVYTSTLLTTTLVEYVDSIALDSTRVFIVYMSNNVVYGTIVTISGNTVSQTTSPVVIYNGNASNCSTALISTNRVLVVYQATGLLKAVVINISGAVIVIGTTYGTLDCVAGSIYKHYPIEILDNDRSLVVYEARKAVVISG